MDTRSVKIHYETWKLWSKTKWNVLWLMAEWRSCINTHRHNVL